MSRRKTNLVPTTECTVTPRLSKRARLVVTSEVTEGVDRFHEAIVESVAGSAVVDDATSKFSDGDLSSSNDGCGHDQGDAKSAELLSEAEVNDKEDQSIGTGAVLPGLGSDGLTHAGKDSALDKIHTVSYAEILPEAEVNDNEDKLATNGTAFSGLDPVGSTSTGKDRALDNKIDTTLDSISHAGDETVSKATDRAAKGYKVDPFRDFREPCLERTYESLPPLRLVRDSLNNKQDDDYPYPGFLFADLIGSLTDEQQEFLMKAIGFVGHKKSVINPSRGDPTRPGLRFGVLPEDRSLNANKFLMLDDAAVLCLSTVVISGSDFTDMRIFSTGETQYGVKDARVQFPQHEWQRLVAFLGSVLRVSKLYFNGMAIGTPTINVGTQFVTLDTIRGARSSNRTTSKWGPLPSASTSNGKGGKPIGQNRCTLFPSDDVPVYDFSQLNFDFGRHFDLDHLDLVFDRISEEPIANVPAIIAYYPSVWIKDRKPIVSFNISWVGVLEA